MSDVSKIRINSASGYDVRIGNGILEDLGEIVAGVHEPCNVVIITDSNVEGLYKRTAMASLKKSGFSVLDFVFPAGEESKSLVTFGRILDFLAGNEITRSDMIVALGGGVVGDMSGYAAASYLRGIDYVQVPTTLLAMVDSSIGGKTGVDLRAGKNLCGAFYNPRAVVCDPDVLKTLPPDYYSDGIAECVKYGVLGYTDILELTGKVADFSASSSDELVSLITSSIKAKQYFVENDAHEKDIRKFLNLGHTFGHAVERCSSYKISHGRAVAIGMALITKAFEKLGHTQPGTYESLEKLLKLCGLPVSTEYEADELYTAILVDKKRKGGEITLVVPKEIGTCELKTVPVEDVKFYLELALRRN